MTKEKERTVKVVKDVYLKLNDHRYAEGQIVKCYSDDSFPNHYVVYLNGILDFDLLPKANVEIIG